jgi:hypothetical protein
MRRLLGTSALVLGMTIALASASWAQAGRDGPQGGTTGMENSTGGSAAAKGSARGSGGAMYNGTSTNKLPNGGTNSR